MAFKVAAQVAAPSNPTIFLTVPKNPSIFDPVDTRDIEPTRSIPSISASLSARVWTGARLGFWSSLAGVGAVYVLHTFLLGNGDKKDSADSECSVRKLIAGGAIGFLCGLAFFAQRDLYVNFELQADYVGKDDALRSTALKKANYIFKAYAETFFKEKDTLKDTLKDALFDTHFEYNLFVYPVRGSDGRVYEHADIYNFLTVTHPKALQEYEEKCRRNPDTPDIDRPVASPVRGTPIYLRDLSLCDATMLVISQVLSHLFKNLKKWEKVLQKSADDHYENRIFSPILQSQEALTKEEIEKINEKDLADKVCKDVPLSFGELLIIRQLFHHYTIEIQARDNRIFDGIFKALAKQKDDGLIETDKLAEEVKKLGEWHTLAKKLYKELYV